jgi:hypothetical protein
MNRVLVNVASAIAVTLLFLGAAPAVSAQVDTESTTHSGVVIARLDDSLSLWTDGGRLVFELNPTTEMPKRAMGEGNLVVVREKTAGSGVAESVILVDQEVWVEGSGTNELAIIGRAEPSVDGPSQLIIRTADGQEMFVVDPETFHQPFPERGQRVALTYRVENINPPLYKATGLVLLPDSFDASPVKVTYNDIVRPAKQPAAPVVAAKPAPGGNSWRLPVRPVSPGRSPSFPEKGYSLQSRRPAWPRVPSWPGSGSPISGSMRWLWRVSITTPCAMPWGISREQHFPASPATRALRRIGIRSSGVFAT